MDDKMDKYLWFDMDGTIYDLYKIPDWERSLRNNDMTVFGHDEYARKSLVRIRTAVRALIASGWRVGVITWAPIGVTVSDKAFDDCYEAKIHWLERNFPEINPDDFYLAEYGDNKVHSIYNPYAINILVDDNVIVRKMWREHGKQFKTIDASHGYVKELEGLVL